MKKRMIRILRKPVDPHDLLAYMFLMMKDKAVALKTQSEKANKERIRK